MLSDRDALVDRSILQSSKGDRKLMTFYFDKYNFRFGDLNPFCLSKPLEQLEKSITRFPRDELSIC